MKPFYKLLLVLFLFGIIFSFNSAYSQKDRYVVFKGGFGLPYGAYGLNLEYRWKRIGGYAGGGYMKSQYYSDIVIPSSFNGALGLKYYFFRPQELWHPVLGIHAGWLNNYYHKNIGYSSYNPTVYGLAFIAGVEMIEDMMSIEMSMVIDPAVAILNPEKHPNYMGKVYFTPTIGVGVNLYAFKMYLKNRERKKNREIINMEEKLETNSGPVNQNEIKVRTKDTNTVISERLVRECNDTLAFPAVKIYTDDGEGNYWVGKQIAEEIFLFVKFSEPITGTEKTLYTYNLDSAIKTHTVFIIKMLDKNEKLSGITQKLMNKEPVQGEIYQCKQGRLMVYNYGNMQKEISVQLNDLKLINGNNSELYYDEILICLVSRNK